MNERIWNAFDEIHAEEELKRNTKAFLEEMRKEKKPERRGMYKWIPIMVCFFLTMTGFGGYRIYFTEASVISVDINPSLELNLNTFDRVISVKGYNEDGKNLAEEADVKFLDYKEALEEILCTECVKECMDNDELLLITVAGKNEEKNTKMLKDIEEFLTENENMQCTGAGREEIENAHKAGLSVGKYRAFLELKAKNPDITPEEVQGLTMRQIRNLTEEAQGEVSEDSKKRGVNFTENGKREKGQKGEGKRARKRARKRAGKK